MRQLFATLLIAAVTLTAAVKRAIIGKIVNAADIHRSDTLVSLRDPGLPKLLSGKLSVS